MFLGLTIAVIALVLFLIWRLKLHMSPDPNIPGRSHKEDMWSSAHLEFHRHAFTREDLCAICKENPASLQTLQRLRKEELEREAAYRAHAEQQGKR